MQSNSQPKGDRSRALMTLAASVGRSRRNLYLDQLRRLEKERRRAEEQRKGGLMGNLLGGGIGGALAGGALALAVPGGAALAPALIGGGAALGGLGDVAGYATGADKGMISNRMLQLAPLAMMAGGRLGAPQTGVPGTAGANHAGYSGYGSADEFMGPSYSPATYGGGYSDWYDPNLG